ncbi:MAG: DUF87 domain-containing protein [Gammaproteobacteria bacterium]|nr:DUF87 domain-containing protein [Gammaproteobacteria bacterium]
MSVDYEKLGVFYLGREHGGTSALPVLYDSKDLTTHAVCVGMTGSGKTGLCLSLLEEAAIDGIPAICIDPKGDLGNLLLTFPQLRGEDFAPWVDPAEAARQGVSIDALATATAERWRRGLGEWQQTAERIARFRDAVDIAIYTPGADSGLPLSILRSFAPPAAELLADAAALRERIGTVTSGLLALLGRDADPLQSRDHILLANILERAWRAGESPTLETLIHAVQRPAFDKLGAFDLESFYPSRERMALAMAINNLLASPGFASWMQGEPLDAARLLYTNSGKPRLSIISIGHLADAERMFVVTLVLNEIVGWMRRQPGTSSLRALLYMDEIFGYFPPNANPPAKLPMLTLLKQARAFGVGCVLATQNPVDLDYKGLANCGTWLIGRLQTERDKARLIDGLEGAGGIDRAAIEQLMDSLTQRVFLVRNVHDDAPYLLQTRWSLSFLRGPLTGAEIARVMASRKSAQAGLPGTTGSVTAAAGMSDTARLPLPADITEYFLQAASDAPTLEYRPQLFATAKLHFVDARRDLDAWQTSAWIADFADDARSVDWSTARPIGDAGDKLRRSPEAGVPFAELPAAAMRPASFKAWGKSLAAHLHEAERLEILWCPELRLASSPGEGEAAFRLRLTQPLREQRDLALETLRKKQAPKLLALRDRIDRALDRERRERDQLQQQRTTAAVSLGASLLGAVFGRKVLSAGNIGRAAAAARAAGRVDREAADVAAAVGTLRELQDRAAALEAECVAELEALAGRYDPAAVMLEPIRVAARKSDIAIGEVALVWVPWRRGGDGFPAMDA